jgi:hypothetical protein
MNVKSKAVSLATCGNWVTNMIFGKFTPIFLGLVGAPGVFTIFGIFGVICGVFVILNIPETKGVAIEEMDTIFANFKGGSVSAFLARKKGGAAQDQGALATTGQACQPTAYR